MLNVRPLGFVSGEPAVDILRTAEAKQASLVLLGAHKPLLLEGRLSGTVSDVVAESHCPVGVLVDRGLRKVPRVLVAYAGGPEDLAALEVARRIAHAPGTSLTLFHVIPPGDTDGSGPGRHQIANALQDLAEARPESRDDSEARATDQILDEAGVDSGSIHVRLVEHSSPPDAVLDECRRGYDLVVIGMHARWGLGAGTISLRRRRVLAEAPVSILAVHPPLGITVASSASEPSASRLASTTSG
jgi:nucleotide-binding universal stress UspA family protein